MTLFDCCGKKRKKLVTMFSNIVMLKKFEENLKSKLIQSLIDCVLASFVFKKCLN